MELVFKFGIIDVSSSIMDKFASTGPNDEPIAYHLFESKFHY